MKSDSNADLSLWEKSRDMLNKIFDDDYNEYLFISILSVAIFFALISMFIGRSLTSGNPYNSYTLQANAWVEGRLDLGQDYEYLELAIKDGKYYVSFPPFPSYVLFPFAFVAGLNTPDNLIVLFFVLLATTFLFLTAKEMKLKPWQCMLCTFFAQICSNYVFTMMTPYVWFIAQTMCFALSVMCIYFSLKNKLGWAMLFWACSVGCRPMQIVYGVVPIGIAYTVNRRKDAGLGFAGFLIQRIKAFIPMGVVALSYMVLNYMRFGSVTEFGHNYLPEFVRSSEGQFSLSYVKDNLACLFYNISFDESGKMVINPFNNLSMLVASPIITFTIIAFIASLILSINRDDRDNKYQLNVLALLFISGIYMFIVVMHKTMGGWHFGNRYANDIIPWIYYSLLLCLSKYEKIIKFVIPFAVWGIVLNAVGTVIVYSY